MDGKKTDLPDRCPCLPHLLGVIALLAALALTPEVPATDTSTRLLSEAGAKFIKESLGPEFAAIGPVNPFSIDHLPGESVPLSATGEILFIGTSDAMGDLLSSLEIRRFVQFFWFGRDRVRNEVRLNIYVFSGEDAARNWWIRNAAKLGYRSPVSAVSLADAVLEKDRLVRLARFGQYVFNERRFSFDEVPPGTAINACINVLSATPFQSAVENLRKGMSQAEASSLLGKPHARYFQVEVKGKDHDTSMSGDIWRYTYEPLDTYDFYLVFTDGKLSQWLRKETESTICCVVEGTLVEGEYGPLDIGELRVGDRIWGYDLARREKQLVTVLSIRRARANESLLIGEGLRVTKWHHVYVNGDWVRADRLRSTDRLLFSGERSVETGRVRRIQGEVTVYDIAVTYPHNFFAGGILVHNRKGP